MKFVSIILVASFFNFSAIAQSENASTGPVPLPQISPTTEARQLVRAAATYKTTCIVFSENKMDLAGRGVSKSWERKLEVLGGEVIVTRSYYSDEKCKNIIRRNVNLGVVHSGSDQSLALIELNSAFMVHEDALSEEIVEKLEFKEIQDTNSQVPRVAPFLLSLGKDMQNPKYYFERILEDIPDAAISAGSRRSTMIPLRINAERDEVIYLTQTMKLVK